MSDKPAILGGLPIFTAKAPMVRSLLPAFDEAFAAGVQDILQSGSSPRASICAILKKPWPGI
jgi:hypothetical protein